MWRGRKLEPSKVFEIFQLFSQIWELKSGARENTNTNVPHENGRSKSKNTGARGWVGSGAQVQHQSGARETYPFWTPSGPHGTCCLSLSRIETHNVKITVLNFYFLFSCEILEGRLSLKNSSLNSITCLWQEHNNVIKMNCWNLSQDKRMSMLMLLFGCP